MDVDPVSVLLPLSLCALVGAALAYWAGRYDDIHDARHELPAHHVGPHHLVLSLATEPNILVHELDEQTARLQSQLSYISQ